MKAIRMNKLFVSGDTLLKICEKENIPISQASIKREMIISNRSEKEIVDQLAQSWQIMKNSVKESLKKDGECGGKIIGGEAKKINSKIHSGKNICGTLMSKVIAYSMGVLEVNASMGLIVASPTAGSSGVFPGVFTALQEEYDFSDNDIVQALSNAGAIGAIISRNATVAGAEGGCQAEIGSASAMAASAACELFGGTPAQCLDAASYALTNILGLVCDPIAGLVECPCQSRNAAGATGALVAAEIVLAGVSKIIKFDEMVEVMFDVGKRLPPELRETALGGVAASPTGCKLCKKFGINIDCLDMK